jgi:hypothetical protein
VSRDGKRLLFSSNFALQSILGYPTEYSDAYLIELGSGGTTTPPPPPPPTGGTWVRVDQNATGTSYSGNWYPNGMSIHSGGSAKLAMDAGARATYYFQGTGVRWIGYKDAWAGIARVYLDGKFVTTVDTYSPTSIAQAVLFEKQGLTSGVTHTLVVEVTQTRNSASGGSWIWIDAFEAIDSGGGGTVPPPDPGDLVMKDGFETGTTSKWVIDLY